MDPRALPRAVAAALAAVALAGCAGGTPSADLFAVERAGSIPGARLRMIVSDGGTVQCDRAKPVSMTDPELLEGRDIQRDLVTPAEQHLRLAPGPGSVLRYTVRSGDGTVVFADNSRRKPPVLDRLVFFVRKLAKERCGLAR